MSIPVIPGVAMEFTIPQQRKIPPAERTRFRAKTPTAREAIAAQAAVDHVLREGLSETERLAELEAFLRQHEIQLPDGQPVTADTVAIGVLYALPGAFLSAQTLSDDDAGN